MKPVDGHRAERPASTSPATGRLVLALLLPAAVLTLVAMVLLWPHDPPQPDSAGVPARARGQVVAVQPAACPTMPEAEAPPPGVPSRCGTATVRISDGADAGRQVSTEIPSGPGAIQVTPGDDVVLILLDGGVEGGRQYSIIDHQRSTALWLVVAAFALAVIAFGRWRGFTALLGLAVTFAVLLLFIVPTILDGRSPVLVAIVGAAAIMLTVLYLTHGFSLTTTIAVAGTLASLTITAVLSAIATAVAHLSGIADERSAYLNITQGDVNMQGLLLAGIVIGSLGVLDDVTVTQSATVTELARANPAFGFRQLYAAATRVGRAHIASVINTIVLAYAGASLPLMLLFAVGNTPIGQLLTGQLIAEEIVRSVVGTIGLITAVPITTALAAFLAVRQSPTAAAPSLPRQSAPVADRAPIPESAAAPKPDPWMAFVERNRDDPTAHR
jgi:uncharacterized membrane protein